MGSDPLIAEAIRLAAAVCSLFLGLTSAAALRSIVSRRDGRGGSPLTAAMVAASWAAASGAWVFIAIARRGAVPEAFAIYCASGFIAGLLSGIFPRAAGIPLIVAVSAAAIVSAAALAPYLAWADGDEAARLAVVSANGQKTAVTVVTAAGGGRSERLDTELPAGAIQLVFSVIEIRGPMSIFFGLHRYRPSAILAGGALVELAAGRGPFSGSEGTIGKALGFTVSTAETEAMPADDFASAIYRLSPDGFISLEAR